MENFRYYITCEGSGANHRVFVHEYDMRDMEPGDYHSQHPKFKTYGLSGRGVIEQGPSGHESFRVDKFAKSIKGAVEHYNSKEPQVKLNVEEVEEQVMLCVLGS